MKNQKLARFIAHTLDVAVPLAFVAALAVWVYVNAEHRQSADSRACERGNVIRADRWLDSQQPEDDQAERNRVKALFPILNCQQTANQDGEAVLLERREAFIYMDVVDRGHIPEVEDGKVVGEHSAY